MIVAGTICDKCDRSCSIREENEFGEITCDDCEQNAAEAAWERFCDRVYGGSDPLTIREQQIRARRLK